LFCTLSGPELSRVPRTWPLKEPALTVTVLQALTAQFSAQAGAAAKFTYCARTIKKDPFCASKKEDTYGNVWLPEEGASWGVDYRIRCLYFFLAGAARGVDCTGYRCRLLSLSLYTPLETLNPLMRYYYTPLGKAAAAAYHYRYDWVLPD